MSGELSREQEDLGYKDTAGIYSYAFPAIEINYIHDALLLFAYRATQPHKTILVKQDHTVLIPVSKLLHNRQEDTC